MAQGYRGSQSQQVWLFDLEKHAFQQVLARDTNCSWPLWRPDGKAFYFVSYAKSFGELCEYELESGKERVLTKFEDDTTAFPTLSRDGSTIVFRHLFDLYALTTEEGALPKPISITCSSDDQPEPIDRRTVITATDVAFTYDTLELAMIAGGDLWVMDTELREPRAVTQTATEERDPVFSAEGDILFYISDLEGQTDIWIAERGDKNKYWWQQTSFKTDRITRDADPESDLKLSPDGSRLAYRRNAGDLWIMDWKSKTTKRILQSWNLYEFEWSPDGKWIAYSQNDDNFNRDIWIMAADGTGKPYNVSRHPSNDTNPSWSPDGKVLAFVGERQDQQTDLFYVWLQASDEDTDRQDRAMQKAIEKLDRARKRPSSSSSSSGSMSSSGSSLSRLPISGSSSRSEERKDGESSESDSRSSTMRPAGSRPPLPKVQIDFEDLSDRVHRIAVSSTQESGLFWSADSKKLAFSATIDGKKGTYAVEFPDSLRASLVVAATGSNARWTSSGQIVWLSSGLPTSVNVSAGQSVSLRFRGRQEVDLAAKHGAAFDLAWRIMRDRFYDERLGNRNWDAIRRKYSPIAHETLDKESLATLIQLMLGELNASHMGFTLSGVSGNLLGAPTPPPTDPPLPTADPPEPNEPFGSGQWRPTTKHLGLRFDPEYLGPGLRVKEVIRKGPATERRSKIEPGEIVVSINDVNVDIGYDLTQVLNAVDSDFNLVVRNTKGDQRQVNLRAISATSARSLLYDHWVHLNREKVVEMSQGKLGYLHISGMNMPDFYRFEQDLYSVGFGKQGLVIDVRENGGGSTTDHLLTALTQPTHAITLPRGGGPGYPQDRIVYAVWNKPIIVLCNQNSFSNAEIFAHAIKTLKRGKVVGVTTAGGVISTGSVGVMDLGTMRMPNRGWYHRDTGEDFELNGAVPDVQIWPMPEDMNKGKDEQLAKAVEMLLEDVKAWEDRPQPKLRKSSERLSEETR